MCSVCDILQMTWKCQRARVITLRAMMTGSNNTVTNPIKGHTVNMEQENMEEQILGELQETDNEEQEKIHFIRWFSLLLLRIKLHYNLSNNLFTILLNVIYFIFVIFCHPLHISGFQKQLVTLRLFRI